MTARRRETAHRRPQYGQPLCQGRPWWIKPGSCLPVRLLRLGQLVRQLIKRGLLLPGNLRCLDMLRLAREWVRQDISLELGVCVVNCGIEHFDVVLCAIWAAGAADMVSTDPTRAVPARVESIDCSIEPLQRHLRPEVAAPVVVQLAFDPQPNFDIAPRADLELGLPTRTSGSHSSQLT